MAVTLGAVVAGATPAGAIVYGEPDAGRHPYVGAMVAFDASGQRLYRCSGSLVSSMVFVTAGHCTFGLSQDWPAVRAEVFVDDDLTTDPDFPAPWGRSASR